MADTTAVRKVLGLLDTAPGLRTADIFIAAVTRFFSALDICVAAPHAFHAGEDCCETMWLRKIDKHRDYVEDLRLQGVTYIPLVWSCSGTRTLRDNQDPATTR